MAPSASRMAAPIPPPWRKTHSVATAYLLWLIGGWCGLHHFYLERHTQGVLWSTSGAMFGLGWLRDAVRIPEYARQANAHPDHEARHAAKVASSPKPPYQTSRLLAWIIVGAWYYFSVGFLASFAMPSSYAYALGAIAMGCGVWGVSSAGRVACSLRNVVAAAVGASVCAGGFGVSSILPALPAAMLAAHRSRRWRTGDPRWDDKPITFGGAVSLLVLIWIFALVTGVFATKWVVEEGIFHKDADGSWDLNGDEFARHAKAFFEDVFSGFGAEINFGGDSSLSVREARRLLGVSAGATEEEITKAFRKMSIKWHPDKYKGDKDEAMEMQTKLNEARETLIGSRKGRAGGKERDVEAEVRAERAEERARRADERARRGYDAEEAKRARRERGRAEREEREERERAEANERRARKEELAKLEKERRARAERIEKLRAMKSELEEELRAKRAAEADDDDDDDEPDEEKPKPKPKQPKKKPLKKKKRSDPGAYRELEL